MGNNKQAMTTEISRDQLLVDLRRGYEGGASIRSLAASTGFSYGTVHSMLRESGAVMRGRGGPNHVRTQLITATAVSPTIRPDPRQR